jgi:hypothetical protein
MLTVNQTSIKSSTVPNVYVKDIELRDAGSLDLRRSTAVGDSSTIRQTRTYPGAETSYSPPLGTQRATSQDEGLASILKIVLQDTYSSGQPQGWLSRSARQDRRFLKLKIIQSTNARLTRALSRGNYFDTPNATMPRGFVNFVDYEIREVNLTRDLLAKESLIIEENPNSDIDVVSLLKEITFNISQSRPNHLSYFVYCELSTDDSSVARVNTHGPVIVETAIQSSNVVSVCSILSDSSERIWAGPAHNHPSSGWMEGAYHTDQPHGTLTRLRIPNFKVKDSRMFNVALESPIDLTLPADQVREDYFSNIYLTRGEKNNSSFMFSFDHLAYMTNKSKFGKLFLNSNTRIVQELLTRSKITELSVIRRKVRSSVGQNSLESTAEQSAEVEYDQEEVVLVTTSDDNLVLKGAVKYVAPGSHYNSSVLLSLSETPPAGYNKMGQVQELNVPVNRGRAISVIDTDVASKSSGRYQYSIRLQVDDGAFSFLREKKSELARIRRSIMDYKERAERRQSYNARSRQFSQRFINREIDSFNYVVLTPQELLTPASSIRSRSSQKNIQPWVAAIVKYIEILDLLSNITDARKNRIVRSIYSHINPISGSPEGIGKFLELIESLDNKVQTLLSPVRLGHTEDKSSSSQASPQTFIATENHFSDTFDANVTRSTGFNYFNTRAPSSDLLLLTSEQLQQRVESELQRYSSDTFDQDQLQSGFDFLTTPMASALVSNSTRYSYVGPSTVEIGSRIVDLLSESRDDLDYTAVKGTLLSMVTDGSSRSLSLPVRRDMIAMLGDSNRGPTRDRLDRLDTGIRALAEASGIFVERGTRGITRSSADLTTVPSDELVASTKGFSRAELQEPENTEREATRTAGALAILGRITDRASLSGGSNRSIPQVYFDLTRSDNLINANIVANNQTVDDVQRRAEIVNTIDMLPEQAKLLLRNRGSYYNNTALSTTASDSQADGFMFNFGMLRVVEYLSEYSAGSLKTPSWSRLTTQALTGLRRPMLCRIRSFIDPDINVGIFESFNSVPVYNEFFLLTPRQSDIIKRPVVPAPTFVNTSPTQAYTTSQLLASLERDVFITLMTMMSRHDIMGQKYQYSWTQPPLPPTDRRGKTVGIPGAPRGTAPPAAPRPATARATAPAGRSAPSGPTGARAGTRTATTTGGGGGY